MSLDLFETIRSKINVSDVVRQKVNLSRKHNEYIGLCPFHSEKSPSFTVNDMKRFYHCFGCSAHGDVIKFVAETTGLKYREAAIKLANEHNIPIPKFTKKDEQQQDEIENITSILELSVKYFQSNMTQNIRDYLINERGISNEMINNFEIGYAPPSEGLIKFMQSRSIPIMHLEKAGLIAKRDNKIYEVFRDRIIFPIRNIYKHPVAFGGRARKDRLPKYLNSPETIIFQKGKMLFGEDRAISAGYKSNQIILTEGYIDVIALNQIGIKESVASLGTAVTLNHIKKIWKYVDNIIIALDADEAGKRASSKIIDLVLPVLEPKKNLFFLILPEGKDPADVILTNKTREYNFQEFLDNKIDISNMIWNLEFAKYSFDTPGDRALFQNEIESYTKQISNPIIKKHYSRFFKDKIWHHFFKYKANKPVQNQSSGHLKTKQNNISTIESLEIGLIYNIIKYPLILSDQEIKNFLSEIHLKTDYLEKILEILTHNLSDQESIKNFNLSDFTAQIQKAGLSREFDLVLEFGKKQLDISEDVENLEQIKLGWQITRNKYHGELLKLEYLKILSSREKSSQKALEFYQSEILKNKQDLDSLYQTLQEI